MSKKEVKLDKNGYRKFGIRDSIAYALGDLGCNMSFALKGTMSIFWTQFMGMDLWYALLLCDLPLEAKYEIVSRNNAKKGKVV